MWTPNGQPPHFRNVLATNLWMPSPPRGIVPPEPDRLCQRSWSQHNRKQRKAVTIWPALTVDAEAVREAELEERKTQVARYSLDDLAFDPDSRALFDALRPQIMALGDDIVELCDAKTVTYRVYDFLLEIIPRKRRLMFSPPAQPPSNTPPGGRMV